MAKHDTKCKELSICPYSYDAWKMLYPFTTRETWQSFNQPHNILNFICMTIGNLEEEGINTNEIEKIQIVPLDEEYLYKKGTKKEYCATKTPEEALSLLRKNRMDIIYNVSCIPVVISTDNMGSRIKEETQELIMNNLKTKYPEAKIFLPGYYLDRETILRFHSQIISMAKVYMENDISLKCKNFEDIRYNGKDQILYIPFVVCERFQKTTFTMQELFSDDENSYSHKFFLPSMLGGTDPIEIYDKNNDTASGFVLNLVLPLYCLEETDGKYVPEEN